MIYTTYFAQLRNLPDDIIPISICAKPPSWYHGLEYKKLAPKYGFFQEWKKNHDNEYYVVQFYKQVLSCIAPQDCIMELQLLVSEKLKKDFTIPIYKNTDFHIGLICYEKPSDFCHRHIVSDWLNKNGFQCKEWKRQ